MDLEKLSKDKRLYWGLGIATVSLLTILIYNYRREISKTAGNVVSVAKATTAKYSKQFINYLGKVGQILTAPRGVRNNNPGNINQTTSLWNGEIPHEENSDGRFKQFYDYTYGVRALMLNLKSYFDKGKNTVRKIIETWAPAAENGNAGTEAYVQAVSKAVGVKPDTVLTFDKKYVNGLVKAIAQHENGSGDQWVTDVHLTKAWSLMT
jgi:hypothetical protein